MKATNAFFRDDQGKWTSLNKSGFPGQLKRFGPIQVVRVEPRPPQGYTEIPADSNEIGQYRFENGIRIYMRIEGHRDPYWLWIENISGSSSPEPLRRYVEAYPDVEFASVASLRNSAATDVAFQDMGFLRRSSSNVYFNYLPSWLEEGREALFLVDADSTGINSIWNSDLNHVRMETSELMKLLMNPPK